tara:strand:+ start:59 stop:1249 length:1191 start_codon:yes stop_codon:yes gene_type:complete
VETNELKIGLFGPWLFQLAVGLREVGVNDVSLFVDEKEGLLSTALRDAPELNDSDFVLIDRWLSRSALLHPKRSSLTKMLREFDVLILSYLSPVFGPYTGAPYIFFPTGHDLTGVPFPIRSRVQRPRGLQDLSAPILAYRQRKGIRRASAISVRLFKPLADALSDIGKISSELIYIPLAHDDDLFSPVDLDVKKDDDSETLKIFSPSRLMMSGDRNSVRSGNTKHSGKFLKGFSQAVKNGLDAELFLVEQKFSPDKKAARQLVDEMKIGDNVSWKSSIGKYGFSWKELSSIYQSSDVVADDFGGFGWYGGVAIEGLLSGLPVMSSINEEVLGRYCENSPFINVLTPDEIEEAMFVLADKEYRQKVGDFSRKWAVENHGRKTVAKRFLKQLSEFSII